SIKLSRQARKEVFPHRGGTSEHVVIALGLDELCQGVGITFRRVLLKVSTFEFMDVLSAVLGQFCNLLSGDIADNCNVCILSCQFAENLKRYWLYVTVVEFCEN